jgi:hypothetical protein
MKISTIQRACINALAQVTYITCIALLMRNAQRFFGKAEDTMMAPIIFLLLFVISALISGLLILGKPIMLFMDGSKKDALHMLLYTLGFLIVFFLIGVFSFIFL